MSGWKERKMNYSEIIAKIPSRTFTIRPIDKISIDDFLDGIKKKIVSGDSYYDSEEIDELVDSLKTGECEDTELTYITESQPDVTFDKENCCKAILRNTNGYPYLFCESGGDWEYPVSYMIYMSEGKFHQYVPENGNTYNKVSHTAFGSEGEVEIGSGYAIDYDELGKVDPDEDDPCQVLMKLGMFKATGTYQELDNDLLTENEEDVEEMISEFETKFGIV